MSVLSRAESFQAVTVLDPEGDVCKSDFTVSQSASAGGGTGELLSEGLEALRVDGGSDGGSEEGGREREGGEWSEEGGRGKEGRGEAGGGEEGGRRGGEGGEEGWRWVSALFVFGGMDTAGHIHADSFIFVPH